MASSCNVAMEFGSAGLGGCESNPEVSLSRRLPAVCSGYRGHAYASRRGSRHGSASVLLRLEPLHRAGLGHGLSRLCLAGPRGGFRLLTVHLFALSAVDTEIYDIRVDDLFARACQVAGRNLTADEVGSSVRAAAPLDSLKGAAADILLKGERRKPR